MANLSRRIIRQSSRFANPGSTCFYVVYGSGALSTGLASSYTSKLLAVRCSESDSKLFGSSELFDAEIISRCPERDLNFLSCDASVLSP